MAVKRDPRHTNNAILFVLAAILLGGAIYAGIRLGMSSPEPADTARAGSAEAGEALSAVEAERLADEALRRADEAAAAAGAETVKPSKNVLPTDQDKIAMLAGSAFSDQWSSGPGYCYGQQATFDLIGTDGIKSFQITNREGRQDVSGNWDIQGGRLVMTNVVALDADGNEMPDQKLEDATVNLKVWANGQSEPNATTMTESGQVQISDWPVMTYCRTS